MAVLRTGSHQALDRCRDGLGTLARNSSFCDGCSVEGSFVWEYLRLQGGMDFVVAGRFALGPALRLGFARWNAPEGTRSVVTMAGGVRVTLAIP